MTPSDIVENFHPVSTLNVPYPISWADEERDLSARWGMNSNRRHLKNYID